MTRVTEAVGRPIVNARATAGSGTRCELCGRPGDSVHHRLKAGRDWSPCNTLRLCGSGTTGCHGAVEAEPTAALSLGLWLPSTADPSTEPAVCHPAVLWLAWWLPARDGTWTYHGDLRTLDRVALDRILSRSVGA